jgi:uncharacterized protein (DUF2147 family)
MKLRFAAALVGAVLTLGLTAGKSHADDPTVAGFWEEADDKGVVGAWFLFEEKEDGIFQGRLVKAFKKAGEPLITVCTKCPDDRKGAKMLGLTIIKDMKRDGLAYRDGTILDPRDGSIYHAQMDLSPDGQKLGVRGYIGVPLLGQTQTWNRLPDDSIKPADIPKETLAPPPKP